MDTVWKGPVWDFIDLYWCKVFVHQTANISLHGCWTDFNLLKNMFLFYKHQISDTGVVFVNKVKLTSVKLGRTLEGQYLLVHKLYFSNM